MKAGQMFRDVFQVALQNLSGLSVACSVDHLWKIDQRRALVRDENIEGREVTMNPAGCKEQSDLTENFPMQQFCYLRQQLKISQTGRRLSGLIDQKLHEQHVFVKQYGLWHAHTGVERVA